MCVLTNIMCSVCFQGAEKIGYPVVIKASEGGGGKGIRKVESSEDFPSFFRQVCFHLLCVWISLHFYGVLAFFLNAGSDRGPWITHFHHATGSACEAPWGADISWWVWKCHLLVWTRLLHPEEAPEDHRGGSCHRRSCLNFRANGEGQFALVQVFNPTVDHFLWFRQILYNLSLLLCPSMLCKWPKWWVMWVQVRWSTSTQKTEAFTS